MPGAVEIAPGRFQVTVTIESPAVEMAICRVQPDDAEAVDTDGDGPAVRAVKQVVTDLANPDTDGDGRSDDDKVGPRIVNTDPVAIVSDDAELVAGTNPSEPSDQP